MTASPAWESASPYVHAPSRPPVGRLALRPPFIPAGVSARAAEQSIPPVMQCAHLPFRRQQGSSHPLTCHGMVPQASRTHFSGITKPRDFRRGVSCWRYLSSQAVSSQVLSAEASLTDLSRDGAAGIPNCTLPDTTKPRDFRRGVSCWRYLSSQAVSSQVLSAEASLTDLSRDGAAGIPNCTLPDTTKPRDFRRGVSCWRYLSSQAVSSQVLSAEASLTSVFGMGTGGPSP